MEHIKQALEKANVAISAGGVEGPQVRTAIAPALRPVDRSAPETWAPRKLTLNAKHMEESRIVSFATPSSDHVAFNLLRTRVRSLSSENNWKTIGITSPTPGCGKTMVGLNLAFSLARAPNLRVVAIDLDLKKSSMAPTLGVKPPGSIGQFLRGKAAAEDCFVEVGDRLIVGLNSDRAADSSELIQSARMGELLDFVNAKLNPDLVLFDLPPMGVCDDVLAFLPRVHAVLLVVAAGMTTVTEVDECERQISQYDKLMGVVMNKSDRPSKEYY